jgi:hypothetical protein
MEGVQMNDTIILDSKKCNAELLTIHADGRITVSKDLKPTETAEKVLQIMRDQWLADIQCAKIRELQERIKRLEEALIWRWRPIETAPHNHTWVLGYDEKDGEIGMIIFERGDESEPQWTDLVRPWSPTHWMPLPDEPKAKEVKP